MNRERLAARLLTTFLVELEEQVRGMNADLLALEAEPTAGEHLRSLFRSAHTLKGAAHAAGVPLIEEVCHALEALLARAREGDVLLGEEDFALLFSAVDALADAGERVRSGRSLEDAPLAGLSRSLRGPGAEPPREARTERAPAATPLLRGPAAELGDQVRVESEKLDALLATAGQLLTASGRVSARPADLRELGDFAARWAEEWRRAIHPLRQALDESSAPASAVQAVEGVLEKLRRLVQDTSRLTAAAEEDARTIARATDDLGHRVRRLRMRPFADACEALPRMVRDLAAAAGREVRLETLGTGVEADREVWAAVRDALLHLVRNAVDHGIEPPEAREKAGKPRVGTVAVSAALRGDRVAVTVADDGAGLDIPALRARLEREGASVPESEDEVVRALFRGGISTRAEATMISGRGVGLDSVRAAVERIRGSVGVTWTAGGGAAFTLECPLALTSVRALLVAVGSQVLALPTTYVERLLRVRPDEIRRVDGREMLSTPEAPIPLVSLARLLGPPLVEQPAAGSVPVLRLSVGGRRLAVSVDDLLAEQELLVRPLRRVRNPPAYLSGAAVLPTGRVALVLNSVALVEAGLNAAPGAGGTEVEAQRAPTTRRRILVVDDSITTRTLEQSILEAAGYDVLTAVDGADGLRMLHEQECDLVVSDVEMPRMDGFALCEAIRGSRRLRETPVVLVTALETPEHRARGLEVGADAYLAKSSFDQEHLLQTIRQLVG